MAENNKLQLTDVEKEYKSFREFMSIDHKEEHKQVIKKYIAEVVLKDIPREKYGFVVPELFSKGLTMTNLMARDCYIIGYKSKDGGIDISTIVAEKYLRERAQKAGFCGLDRMKTYKDEVDGNLMATMTGYKMIDGQRCPFTATIDVAEYDQKRNLWNQKKKAMIHKVLRANIFRYMEASLQDFYIVEEVDEDNDVVVQKDVPTKEPEKVIDAEIEEPPLPPELQEEPQPEIKPTEEVEQTEFEEVGPEEMEELTADELMDKMDMCQDKEQLHIIFNDIDLGRFNKQTKMLLQQNYSNNITKLAKK